MKRFNIVATQNGWVVVCGTLDMYKDPCVIIPASWSFNSIDKAVSKVRELMLDMHLKPKKEGL